MAGSTPCRSSSKPVLKGQRTAGMQRTPEVGGLTLCNYRDTVKADPFETFTAIAVFCLIRNLIS